MHLNKIFIVIVLVSLSSCIDEPPVIPGLTKSQLVLFSNPEGAEITLNNNKTDISTPGIFDELEPGFYRFDLKKENYLDTMLFHILSRSSVDSIFIEMREDPAFWWEIYNTDNSNIPTNLLGKVRIDNQNNKWICTRGSGLIKFDGENFSVFNTSNSGIPGNSINDIFIDDMNIIWLGTQNGFCSFNGSEWIVYNTANAELPENNITTITKDLNNVVWAGTSSSGLIRFNGVDFKIYNYSNSDIPSNNISALAFENNKIWVGTSDEGLAVYDGTNWVKYNALFTDLPGNFITSLFIDNNGFKWIGFSVNSGFGGISRFDDLTFQSYNSFNSPFPGVRALDITQDSKNAFWFATDNGLARFDGSNWKIYNSSNAGFTSNQTVSIAIDSNEDKWISSIGLAKYTGQK